MEKNKKNYYKNNKKNYYKKNNNKNEVKEEKMTYDKLMHAETISEPKEKPQYDRVLVIRSIAISIVIFAIIVCSLILFSKM